MMHADSLAAGGLRERDSSRFRGLGENLRSKWPEWAALTLYAVVVGFTIPRHEPFVDEAQAWQLARSLPLTSLFRTYIRYEGSPGLWHFFLWLLIRAHLGYAAMHWVCGVIAASAASLLLFFSPFPQYIKLALPLGYFLIFQYAVVARSYLLAPLFLFLIAICWKKLPLAVAVLLGLLANTALHAAVISGGLAIVYVFEQFRTGALRSAGRRRLLLACAAVVLCSYVFAIWTAWPPKDLTFLKYARHAAPPFAAGALVSLVMGVCQPAFVSVILWVAVALFLGSRKRWIYLLPVLLFAAFSAAGTFSWWHVGLLTPLAIAILWITWDDPATREPRYDWPVRAALVYMAAVQILWAGYALQYDWRAAYSPDATTATFLKPFVDEHATIISASMKEQVDTDAFLSVGIQPYFDRNIFANQRFGFWWWSSANDSDNRFETLLIERPRVVVLEASSSRGGKVSAVSERTKWLEGNGYRVTNIFCGSMPLRFELGTTSCHLIYQPAEALSRAESK